MLKSLRLYRQRQASSLGRYLIEQLLYFLVAWIPTIVGIATRGVLYRLIMHFEGWAAIENGVRLRFANHIHLEHGAYLDQGVYLHACPQGIHINPVLAAKSFAVRMPVEKVRSIVEAAMKAAEGCRECRQCVERCPYHLDIPVLLKRQRAAWDRYLAIGRWE